MKFDASEQDARRMDCLDKIVHEYLRSNRKTVEYLADKAGCAPSSLWRYTSRVEHFRKAPLCVIAAVFRITNVSNTDLRYILGLPTGKSDEK